MKRLLATALLAAALLAGCGGAEPTGKPPVAGAPAQMVNITAAELHKRLQAGEKPLIIDVREPDEYAAGHIAGAQLMPLGSVDKSIKPVGKKQEVVLVCRSGNRSAQAYQILAAMGYSSLKNMEGGMIAWEKNGAPVIK